MSQLFEGTLIAACRGLFQAFWVAHMLYGCARTAEGEGRLHKRDDELSKSQA